VLRLLKVLAGAAGLVGFTWFGANVRLGKRTLFEHLQAIGSSASARDLAEGTHERAAPVIHEAREVAGDVLERIPERDRQKLRQLLRQHSDGGAAVPGAPPSPAAPVPPVKKESP
jgi:hypothetical protein